MWDAFYKTPGYCWPTPKCRNVCVQHACFEDKKAKETSPRKSTPRTLKQVGQQYPPVFATGCRSLPQGQSACRITHATNRKRSRRYQEIQLSLHRGGGVRRGAAQRITSSAWKSTIGGMVRPRAWAVLRLMIRSNFVGCSTGKSAGLAPF